MDTNEPIQRSDWAIYRDGAVFFEGTEDCMLDRCILGQLGGNAVFVTNYNRRIRVQTCRIQGCGASGVAFLGNPAAVRSSRSKEEGRIDYADLDRLPGPLTDNYPAEWASRRSGRRKDSINTGCETLAQHCGTGAEQRCAED